MASREPFLDHLTALVPLTEKAVLDIGCGNGLRSNDLAQLAELVVAVDPDRQAIRRAKQSQARRNLEYRVAEATALPFPAGSFDLTIFTMSFHHVPTARMPKAVAEAIRVTRRRGYVAFFEPDWAGSLYEAEARFDFGDGDNRSTKAYAYHVMLTEPRLQEIDEFIDRASFRYASLANFIRREHPRAGTRDDWQRFLERHRGTLEADQRLNLFRRT